MAPAIASTVVDRPGPAQVGTMGLTARRMGQAPRRSR